MRPNRLPHCPVDYVQRFHLLKLLRRYENIGHIYRKNIDTFHIKQKKTIGTTKYL